jgi:iron complex transport system ATP-binding protein
MNELTATELVLAYESACIIDSLSVTIPQGKITAFVGPNGCGKSTLLRGISQGPVAPEGLTVHELVAQGRYPHQSWFQQWSAEDERVTQEALEITRTAEFADRPVDTLSGGQRQRAWIAMTLAQDSDLILLDEPTTFLDLAYQIEVLDLLHDLNVERGKTIVMVLHDLNHACRYADTLVAIREGRIAAQGVPEQVVTETLVRDVFGIDCRVIADPVTGTPLVVPIGKGKGRGVGRSADKLHRNGKHETAGINKTEWEIAQ